MQIKQIIAWGAGADLSKQVDSRDSGRKINDVFSSETLFLHYLSRIPEPVIWVQQSSKSVIGGNSPLADLLWAVRVGKIAQRFQLIIRDPLWVDLRQDTDSSRKISGVRTSNLFKLGNLPHCNQIYWTDTFRKWLGCCDKMTSTIVLKECPRLSSQFQW